MPPAHWRPALFLTELGWASVSSGGKDHGLRSWASSPWLWPTLTLCLFSLVSIPPALSSSIWLLLKNPVFILLCLAGATEATLIAGMSTFGPKFLESQFSLSTSEAATLFGEKSPEPRGAQPLQQLSHERGVFEGTFWERPDSPAPVWPAQAGGTRARASGLSARHWHRPP